LIALALVAQGCSEVATIRSAPPGANVYIDDVYRGTTPYDLIVDKSEVTTRVRSYRIELEGYKSAEGQLSTGIAGGRITGCVFTLGIVCAARSMHYFLPVDVVLTPLSVAAPRGAPDEDLADRLQRLEEAHDKRLISDEEYQRYRREALEGK
jgi:hypothetical protein